MTTIKWDSDDTGAIVTVNKYGTTSIGIYSLKYALRRIVQQYCNQLVIKANPEMWQDKKYRVVATCMFDTISRIYPKISFSHENSIFNYCQTYISIELEKALREYKLTDTTISNYVFLALLGQKRNWRKNCAICLNENMKDSVVVFRPCGHSICKYPCFQDFIKTKNVSLKEKKFIAGDKEFIAIGYMNADINTNFECHLCRQTVTTTFEAGDVCLDESLLDLDDTANKLYKYGA